MIFRDYLLVGIVVATILWYVSSHMQYECHLIIAILKVFFKPRARLSSITCNTSRFVSGMGLRL